MSFLDNLFVRAGTPELLVAGTPISGNAAIAAGLLYQVEGAGAEITLTLATSTLAAVAGKRIGVKVFSEDSEGDAGDVVVAVPGGMLIESDEGELASEVSFAGELGAYREWLCDAAGNWMLVAGATDSGVPPASTYEAGGAEEITVEDLEGRLVDPQDSDALLFASGGAIPLATRPTTNQVLTFNGTSIVGTTPATPISNASEYWSTARSHDAADREMTDLTFPPPGFALYRMPFAGGAGTAFAGTVVNTPVGININPAANQFNYQFEDSWLLMSAAGTNGGSTWDGWFLATRIAARPKYGLWRARLKTLLREIGSIVLRDSTIYLAAAAESGSVPTNTGIAVIGIGTDTSTVKWLASSGIGTSNWGASNLVHMQDAEVWISFEDTLIRMGINGGNGFLPVTPLPLGAAPVAVGSPLYVGFYLNIAGAQHCRVGADYYRQLVDTVNPIPLH